MFDCGLSLIDHARDKRAMHGDDSVRAKLLTAEAADALLLVDIGNAVTDRNGVCGANAFALAATDALFRIYLRTACEHAGENLGDRRILAAPERHLVLGRKLKVGDYERFQFAVYC